MSRRLFLLRHAQSAERQHSQTDFARELTSKGVQQAARVARYLQDQKSFPEIIHASGAERAKATANLIAEVLRMHISQVCIHDELYEASARTFFQFINQIDDSFQQVLCVGHNPAISYLAEFLTKSEIGDMVPAGMAIIDFEIDSWSEASEGNGVLLKYVDVLG